MSETFEDRMRAKRRSHGQGINRTAFIGFSDAVLIAIEADAALASKDAQIANRPFTTEQLKDPGIVLANMQHGTIATPQRFIDEQAYSNGLQDEIARLTALNTAKGELISEVEYFFNLMNTKESKYRAWDEKFETIRARIRRLENEYELPPWWWLEGQK